MHYNNAQLIMLSRKALHDGVLLLFNGLLHLWVQISVSELPSVQAKMPSLRF